ncbi:MAG: hypothetical protein ACP5QG_09260 [candidate division WOR-3 bacterium]
MEQIELKVIRYNPRGDERIIILQDRVEYIITEPMLLRDCFVPGDAIYANANNPWWSLTGSRLVANPIVPTDQVGLSLEVNNNQYPLSHVPLQFFTCDTTGSSQVQVLRMMKKWVPLYWIVKPDTRLVLRIDNTGLSEFDPNQIQPQLYIRGYVLREDSVDYNFMPKYVSSENIFHVYQPGDITCYFGVDSFVIGFSILRFFSDVRVPTRIGLNDLPANIPPVEAPSPAFDILEVKQNGSSVSLANQQGFRFAYGPFDGQFGRINFSHRMVARGRSIYMTRAGVIAPTPPWSIGDWYSLICYALDNNDIAALMKQPHLHRYIYPLFPSENITYEMIHAIAEGLCKEGGK